MGKVSQIKKKQIAYHVDRDSYNLIGFANINRGQAFVDVVFDKALPIETQYVVHGLEIPYQTSYWITHKSHQGFRINVGLVCSAYVQKIGWSIGVSL